MAYLATHDYLEDKSFVDKWLYTMRTGEMDLSWMNANTEKVATRPQNARRGLTYRDLDVGSYGFTEIPEKVRENRSYAPRGAEIPEGVPDAQPWVSRKSELWGFNTESYYEEAVSRQWNATTDIPWDRLEGVEMPEATGKALSQLMTFLTEVEMIATDTPAMWLPRLNPDFIEVKSFIASQAMDEARHAEVFRKRALTTGYGLMAASPMNEMALKHLRDADSFSEMSVALHLVAEGNVLTLFRFSEYLSPTDVDKKIFRLVMQDEARHVGYGMQHFKYVLENFPEKREVLHAHLDEAENISFAGAAATEVTESFIILAGGGLKKENIEEGIKVTTQFNLKQMHEHFERLEKCGMPERKDPARSKLYAMFLQGKADAEAHGIHI
jgi:hypothetical protein